MKQIAERTLSGLEKPELSFRIVYLSACSILINAENPVKYGIFCILKYTAINGEQFSSIDAALAHSPPILVFRIYS